MTQHDRIRHLEPSRHDREDRDQDEKQQEDGLHAMNALQSRPPPCV